VKLLLSWHVTSSRVEVLCALRSTGSLWQDTAGRRFETGQAAEIHEACEPSCRTAASKPLIGGASQFEINRERLRQCVADSVQQ